MKTLLEKTLPNRKLSWDLLANGISLCVLFGSGLLINLLVGYYFGASGLGEFNLIYACYITLSQLSAFGIHYSIVRHIAIQQYGFDEVNRLFNVALTSVCLTAILFSLLLIQCRFVIADWFSLQPVSLVIISLASIFFAMNKVLLGTINALKKMKLFALIQAMRYSFIVLIILLLLLWQHTLSHLFYAFLITEIALFVVMLVVLMANKFKPALALSKQWCQRHLHFGSRAFFAGMMVELNTRIDVFILAVFLPMEAVGIYSFVAMLAEGLYQFVVVVKNIINPYLAQHLHANEYQILRPILTSMRRSTFVLMCLLGGLVLASYPLLVKIMGQPAFVDGFAYLGLFIVGVIFASSMLPFDNIFNQCGKPTLQSIYSGLVLCANIILNIILVQLMGLKGAVIGTVIANYVLSSCLLYCLSMRTLQYNLLHFSSDEVSK